jgi:uncharacterized protein YqcC (DUF446 family)
MNKLFLWLIFWLCFAAFVCGLVWLVDDGPLGYVFTAASLALLLWAALRLRRINLRGGVAAVSRVPPDYAAVAAKLDEIEAEMRRIGMWQGQPPRPEQFSFTQAFAMDTMAFDQWLQFVFVPRVREIVAARSAFPPYSQVAVQAVREFDAHPLDTSRLHTLLHEFDRLFGPPRFRGG